MVKFCWADVMAGEADSGAKWYLGNLITIHNNIGSTGQAQATGEKIQQESLKKFWQKVQVGPRWNSGVRWAKVVDKQAGCVRHGRGTIRVEAKPEVKNRQGGRSQAAVQGAGWQWIGRQSKGIQDCQAKSQFKNRLRSEGWKNPQNSNTWAGNSWKQMR